MYERFYAFTADPFRLNPDHRFCFNHDNFTNAKAYIDYALHRAEGFVMITGAAGTGKTTLVHDLLEHLAQQEIKVATLMNTRLDAENLLRMIAHAFGIETQALNKAMALQELLSFLVQQYQNGKRSLLIIDESQDLSIDALEELRLLTNIQQAGQPLLQIMLIGQESLRDLVRNKELEQLQQRLLAAWHLEPLNPQEVLGYIQHRLSKAGWRGDPEFMPGVVPAIHQFSGGVPRLINLICSRLLLHGCIEELHTITPAAIQCVLKELQQEELPYFIASSVKCQPATMANAIQFDWTRVDVGLAARTPSLNAALPAPPPLNQILQHEDDAHWEADKTAEAAQQNVPAPRRRWPLVLLFCGIVVGASTTALVPEAALVPGFIVWQPLLHKALIWLDAVITPLQTAVPPSEPIQSPVAEITPEEVIPPPIVSFSEQPGVLAAAPEINNMESPSATASRNALESMTTSVQPAAAPTTVALPTTTAVSFMRNSVELEPQSVSHLEGICAQLQQLPIANVEVIGYSDRYGNQAYNLELSRRRAEAVAAYLVAQGVARERLRVEGRGPREQPVVLDGVASTAANRVVELTFVVK